MVWTRILKLCTESLPTPPTQPGLVSIMMPAYNVEQYIEQALTSVLSQTYAHWELIVVDDGSVDHTAEIVGTFVDGRILMIHQENKGEAGARNTALRHMNGEYLAFLDADDAYLPHHLEVAISYLQANPELGGVYTDGHYCDQAGNRVQTLSSRRRGPFTGRLFEEIVRASDVFGPPGCVVLQRDLVRKHDLWFDEDLYYCNDWDFFTRYADVASFGNLPDCTYDYRVSLSSITNRLGLSKRAFYIAKCRAKAVKMPSFRACSLETRSAVFYDLLVQQLRSYPAMQSEIILWPEFKELPREAQARIVRLMASKALLFDGPQPHLSHWFGLSCRLNPADVRASILAGLYRLSPRLCRSVLLTKSRSEVDPLTIPPFADLRRANAS